MLFDGVDSLSYQVVDYVFMGNHFHVIVKIPPIDKISDAELLKRYRRFKNDPEIDFFTDAERIDFRFKIHHWTLKPPSWWVVECIYTKFMLGKY